MHLLRLDFLLSDMLFERLVVAWPTGLFNMLPMANPITCANVLKAGFKNLSLAVSVPRKNVFILFYLMFLPFEFVLA